MKRNKTFFTFLGIVFVLIAIIILYYPKNKNKDNSNNIDEKPYFNLQWALYNDGICKEIDIDNDICKINSFKKGIDINAIDMWYIFNEKDIKEEIIVAILDTGVDYKHKDLNAYMWINSGEIPNDGIDNDNNGYIDDIYGWNFCENNNNLLSGEKYENNHGIHCAGIVTSIVDKANVKIMSIKILEGMEREGSIENVIAGIKYAENMGATICNMSFGTYVNNTELEKTIMDSNMLFIVSAGNNDRGNGFNLDDIPIYPAAYDFNNVITVANIGFDGNLYHTSNYGANSVDVAAPGTYIYSTGVDNSYFFDTGASYATPMVTGVAALVSLYHENKDAYYIKNIIMKSVHKLDNLKNMVKTSGMLDGAAALQYACP